MDTTSNTCISADTASDVMETTKVITNTTDDSVTNEERSSNVLTPMEDVKICDKTTKRVTHGSLSEPESPSKCERSPRKRRITETCMDGEVEEDQEFTWDEYLEESKSIAVPPTAFLHVEYSLESGIKVGMVLEVPNREGNGYWQATVVMNCGPLLSLRYLGYGDDRSNDFWWNINASDSHPVGWCIKNDKKICPPAGILKDHPDYFSLLSHNLEPVPAYLLDGRNSNIPIDQIKVDMTIEVLEELNPTRVWVATIIENVGGRLQLRYLGDKSSGKKDFWLFYLSYRVHPIGWAKENAPDLTFEAPEEIILQYSDEEWESLKYSLLLVNDEHPTLSPDILQPQEMIEPHGFEEGMKLEAVHPVGKQFLYPATVIKVLDSRFFLVEIDDYRSVDKGSPTIICCHAATPIIFPPKWGQENVVKIRYPRGYLDNPGNKEFDWDEYLVFCNGKAAPAELFLDTSINTGFDINAKLEAVNPFQPNQICAATIVRVTEPLLWLQLEGVDSSLNPIIFPLNSKDIFPVGWCESNNYPLKPPRFSYSKRQRKMLRKIGSTTDTNTFSNSQIDPGLGLKENSKSWCSKIYFNHKCFSGPFLSKNRLAQLPRHIGPGPVALVMKEVLSSLINVAYISTRVLRLLQLRGNFNRNMNQEVLKAKWKGKSYRAVVEVVCKSEQVEEFCKEICRKIDCCTYLFGPKLFENTCPEQCQNKSKCSQGGLVKKRKAHKPNAGRKSPGAKKGNQNPPEKEVKDANKSEDCSKGKEETCIEAEEKPEEDKSGNNNDDKKQAKSSKFKSFTLPKSSMVTRGAKIPNFSLEMKWRRQRVRKISSPSTAPLAPRRGRPPLNMTVTKNCQESGESQSDSSETDDENPKVIEISPSNVIRMKNPHWIRSNEQDLVTKLLTPPKQIKRPIPRVLLPSNPIKWTVEEVVNFVQRTDCAPIAPALKKEEIDGQALLLMTLPAAQEFLHLKYAPAVKFCHLVEVIKMAFYLQFSNIKDGEA